MTRTPSTVALMTRAMSSAKPGMLFTTSVPVCAAEQRHAVVGLLAEALGVVAGLPEGIDRKLVVGQLEFLQRQHIDRVGLRASPAPAAGARSAS